MIPAHHPDPRHHSALADCPPRHRRTSPRPYGRADAIADGLMIEVPTRLSRQFHFIYPLAVTAQAWFDSIAWDPDAEQAKPEPTGQHESTRIAEVLWAARQALYTSRTGSPEVDFVIHRVPPTGPQTQPSRITLRISVHAGDCGEQVATIAHAHPATDAAAWFTAEGGPQFPAVALHTDPHGVSLPVVTVDVLDPMLDSLATHGFDATPGEGGAVHIQSRNGVTVTLRPDDAQHYPLTPLATLVQFSITPL